MAVALQVLAADQLQQIARSPDVPLEVVRTDGRMTVLAKRKMVLRCKQEAAWADARAAAALDDATIKRLYHWVPRKPIMQQLIDEIYATNAIVVHSPTTGTYPPKRSPRRSPRLRDGGAAPGANE